MNKELILKIAKTLSVFWYSIPSKIRRKIFFGFFVIESRNLNSEENLKNLFLLLDDLQLVINEQSMKYGNGEHPKHRLTRYHQFFIDRILPNQSVIDIGCGYGAVARSIAYARPNVNIMGVDQDKGRLKQAKEANNPKNLSFLEADATCELSIGKWDVIVLSNVLEHIKERIQFLIDIQINIQPKKILLRVPMFERDWQMPLKKEIKVNYLSDPDHKIEYTLDEFTDEIKKAGLNIKELKTMWGEIWAECLPIKNI